VRNPCSGIVRVAALLAVAGCARFEPKPFDAVRNAGEFDGRTLDAPELRAFIETNLGAVSAWPPSEWNFEQLTLAALFLHPSLDVARAELASARAAEITAGRRPNPTIGATPEYTVNPASGLTPWIATIQFDLPLETAGKRGHRVALARQLSEAARLRLGDVAWQIRSSVRVALLDLRDAGQRTELLSRQLAAQQLALAAMETKFALGAVTTAEIAPARLAMARTRKEIADARVQEDEARARLAASIGVPLNSLPPSASLNAEMRTDDALGSPDARRRALTSRADILAALAEYAAAETALRLEIAKQYPDVHLGTGYQFDQGENKWALGLTMEIPVLNRNQGPIAEAKAKRAEVAARLLLLQARIAGDVDRALAGWRCAQARAAALEELHAAQEARVKSIKTQFDAGAVESLDVLAAEVELAADELLYREARAKSLRAYGELEDAIQFPLSPDLTVNSRRSEP
jgi:cobalt-zinc-cadmium efflux system outer membrane protein